MKGAESFEYAAPDPRLAVMPTRRDVQHADRTVVVNGDDVEGALKRLKKASASTLRQLKYRDEYVKPGDRVRATPSAPTSGASTPMRLVSPTVQEATLLREALEFLPLVPEVGFSLPPRSIVPRWFVDDWRDDLPNGKVRLDSPRPIPVYIKAGRLRYESETALLKTIFHELRHAHQVLTWPRLLEREKDEVEQDAESFAWRALAARQEHQAEWQQLLRKGRHG